MKKPVKILVTAFLIGAAGISSCTKNKQEQIAYQVATSYINNGKWKVSLFQENNKNETDHYDGYTFVFNTDKTVTATKAKDVVKGTWNTSIQGTTTKMNLNFGTAPFNELNKDWIIKSGSAKSIQLQHDSGGNGGSEELDFQKI